ncbi:MAG: hypoxanthine phosphoribosyltransferase [Saprospiraceae bacterium]
MIDKDQIQSRVEMLSSQINEDYKGEEVEMIIVLKGAFIFAADLVRHFNFDHTIHFVQFSSYSGTESTGKIFEKLPLQKNVANKHVLIIEDIVDTGNTLNYFIEKLNQQNPKSVNIASLLFKKDAYIHNFPVKYVAFDIENKFVIGYGLDLDQKFRNLKHIYQHSDK